MLTATEIQNWQKKSKSSGAQLGLSELVLYQNSKLTLPVKRRRGVASQSGQYMSHHRGRGMEFDEVRHYQAGDDIRSIDWRVTARTGKTHTKLYREEKERPVFLVVDFGDSMHFGTQLMLKSVQAAHVAAALAWGAVNQGDRIGALVYNGQQHRELKPAARKRGALHLLNTLVKLHASQSVQQTPGNLFNEQLQRVNKIIKPGTEVAIISDFFQLNEQSIELMRGISRHSPVTAVRITDPFEHILPEATSELEVTDGVQNWKLTPARKSFRQDFENNARQFAELNTALLKKAQVDVVELSAAKPLFIQWPV